MNRAPDWRDPDWDFPEWLQRDCDDDLEGRQGEACERLVIAAILLGAFAIAALAIWGWPR